ncbi:MAG: hypothetical protein IPQ23_22540 [Cytophagaceae bacterium]|nr:hypothetical protein [Cytophagaceae bacterium]
MTSEESKAKAEREVFLEFVQMAGLPVVPGSVESRRPPEPDILCRYVHGEQVAFELVDLVDEDLARVTAQAIQGQGPGGTWFADPTLERVRVKLVEKRYQSPFPIELLAYGDETMDPKSIWMPKFEQRLRDLVDASSFRRLWVANMTGRERGVWLVHPPAAP